MTWNFELSEKLQAAEAISQLGGLHQEDADIFRQLREPAATKLGEQGQTITAPDSKKVEQEQKLAVESILIEREREFALRARIDRTINKYFGEIDKSPWYDPTAEITKDELESFLASDAAKKLTPEETVDVKNTIDRYQDIQGRNTNGDTMSFVLRSDLARFGRGKVDCWQDNRFTQCDDLTIPGNTIPSGFWEGFGRMRK